MTRFTSRRTLRQRSSSDPNYDYDKETKLVVQRLKKLATNDTQKMLVEFFDDKLRVGGSILFKLDQLLGWTFEER